MRRHRKQTSFCMGQCVSSCGSKRTLDSVPTTPDTENCPGLISASSRSDISSKCSQFENNPPYQHQLRGLSSAAGLGRYRSQSPAAKFVASFSQKKIVARRINPEGESPVHIRTKRQHHSPPPHLPLHITTLLSPAPDTFHDGDMKGTPVKNYFRETISSAKKSAAASKSVTFSTSDAIPSYPSVSTTRKKHFFSFSTTLTAKSGNKKKESQQQQLAGEEQKTIVSSPVLPSKKGFLRRKSKSGSPAPQPLSVTTTLPKEKQTYRITLSPKQSSSKSGLQSSSSSSFGSLIKRESKSKTNGVEETTTNEHHPTRKTESSQQQTMGNASSSNEGSSKHALEVVKSSKSPLLVRKSSSATVIKGEKGDINENTTTPTSHHLHSHSYILPTSKSAESPGFLKRNNEAVAAKSCTLDANVLRNLNSIKEENRLLRLKFFLEEPPLDNSTISSENSQVEDAVDTKMNRQNFAGRSAIPLPKSQSGTKIPTNVVASSGIPKLYSVATTSDHQRNTQGPSQGSKGRFKAGVSRGESSVQQPSNLEKGEWKQAANFFNAAQTTSPNIKHTPPGTSGFPAGKGSRRSSEPARWPPGGNRLLRDTKGYGRGSPVDGNVERKMNIAIQPKKLPMVQQATGVPRSVKTALTTSVATVHEKAIPSFKGAEPSSKIGVRKPEETKPFYTLGLYQNRPRTAPEVSKPHTGIPQSGFLHTVSTGMVKQRTQQYQSNVLEKSPVSKKMTQSISSPGGTKTSSNDPISTVEQESPNKKSPGVQRSATYTIKKHPIRSEGNSQIRANSDVDSRYLTFTKRRVPTVGPGEMTRSLNVGNDDIEKNIMKTSIMSETSGISSFGYPLQHNASATSTSSMGTNEDGIGDNVVISDSEYLIDDEISDQPDLTFTFKESSLHLSRSTSGESLVSSDIMLDHLDRHTERFLGEPTSDSAISDISTHNKPILHNVAKLSGVKTASSLTSILDQSSKLQDLRSKASSISESPSPTPSSVRTPRHPKSPRRSSKLSSAISSTPGPKPGRQSQGGSVDTGIPRLSSSTSNSNLATTPKQQQRLTQETPKSGVTEKLIHMRPLRASPPSLTPVNQIRSSVAKKTQVVGLTIENVNKLHKQFESEVKSAAVSSAIEVEDNENANVSFSVGPFVHELLEEFQDMKDNLETLLSQLETQEKREREKDELILRLTGEVDRLKSLVEKSYQRNGNIVEREDELDKERYIRNSIYENAAVQTDNNNIFNRTVTYPEEDDKYGELVSFRIGRSSSLKKKL